jgi:hypothetical protein
MLLAGVEIRSICLNESDLKAQINKLGQDFKPDPEEYISYITLNQIDEINNDMSD